MNDYSVSRPLEAATARWSDGGMLINQGIKQFIAQYGITNFTLWCNQGKWRLIAVTPKRFFEGHSASLNNLLKSCAEEFRNEEAQ